LIFVNIFSFASPGKEKPRRQRGIKRIIPIKIRKIFPKKLPPDESEPRNYPTPGLKWISVCASFIGIF
jgi:hypothetical protein